MKNNVLFKRGGNKREHRAQLILKNFAPHYTHLQDCPTISKYYQGHDELQCVYAIKIVFFI